MIQKYCHVFFKYFDCSGRSGFKSELIKYVLDPDLDYLESDNYHRGNKFEDGVQTVRDEIRRLETTREIFYKQIQELLLDMLPDSLPPEKEGKVQVFLEQYKKSLQTKPGEISDGEYYTSIWSSDIWNEVKKILQPIFDVPGYKFKNSENENPLEELPQITLGYRSDFMELDIYDLINEAQHTLKIQIQSLNNPVLRVKERYITLDEYITHIEFTSLEFTQEFYDPDLHKDPRLINYGYILSLTQNASFNHAICVVRQYPFNTFGDQSLIVLDSAIKNVLVFPSYKEMIQHLLSLGYKGMSGFFSIYGYSKKEYEIEEQQRREKIRLKFQQNLSSLSVMRVSSTGASSSLAEGGGGGGAGMEGGQTFFSFFL
jgi:hypothetical protein